MEAQATHFQQGHEELGRLAPYRRELGAQVRPRWAVGRAVVGTRVGRLVVEGGRGL